MATMGMGVMPMLVPSKMQGCGPRWHAVTQTSAAAKAVRSRGLTPRDASREGPPPTVSEQGLGTTVEGAQLAIGDWHGAAARSVDVRDGGFRRARRRPPDARRQP